MQGLKALRSGRDRKSSLARRHVLREASRERGQSLVELALAMLILPTLLAGVINFGMAFLNWIAVRDAAQEGAAYGSALGSYATADCQNISARVTGALSGTQLTNIQPPAIKVNGYDCGTTGAKAACSGETIEVSVDASFPILVPLVNALPPPTLHASATDTILRPSCP